ncbi:Gfo/Idh/MocA family protein [Cohnella sp. GCM10020058]|uniref:Gfo/Idh/MocA family protein n=1 Tax=Cohnella sp. GCM10020058 TaxID=3317330 RepID=UPI0036333746
MPNQTLKTGMLGAGAIAGNHLEAIRAVDGISACAVTDLDIGKAKAVADKYGIRAYDRFGPMLDAERPDIVTIALPHHLHKEAALQAVGYGCHLMLEKPMALDVQECDEVMEAADKAGVRLLIGHTQQYMAHNLEAKRILQSGELGEIVMINDARHTDYFQLRRPDWFLEKEKAGGGILFNLGAHAIDKIQWLTDGSVRSVRASVSHHGPRGNVEGSGAVFLELDNGIPATMVQSGYPGAARNETEIVCTKGMLKLMTGYQLLISRGGEYEEVEIAEQADPFVLQYLDLLQAIREGREPGCSGAYGRHVIASIEAVYRSAATGKEQKV